MNKKKCSSCKETKFLKHFSKISGRKDAYRSQCRACRCVSTKNYRWKKYAERDGEEFKPIPYRG